MGRRVIDLVHADPALTLVGAITHAAHPALGRDAGEVAGIGPIGVVLEHACARTLCFIAPNMSVGVNVMFQVLRQLVTLLGPGYDIEILEAHHRTKVDAPSGTALRMAAIIAEAHGNHLDDVAVYGRRGMIGRRSDTEIGIQVVRAGEIVGEHTVLFGGPGERLELVHRSQSRDTFANGALRAAKWVIQQPCGLYSMEDLLRLA